MATLTFVRASELPVIYAHGAKVYHINNGCRASSRILDPEYPSRKDAGAAGLTLCRNCKGERKSVKEGQNTINPLLCRIPRRHKLKLIAELGCHEPGRRWEP